MAKWFFDAPAGVKDFKDPEYWNNAMLEEARFIIKVLVGEFLKKKPENVTDEEILEIAPTLAYINPEHILPPANAEVLPIAPWNAFPRAVERAAPWEFPDDPDDITGKYRAADDLGIEDFGDGEFKDYDGSLLHLPSRHRQDEYLEWTVRRDTNGSITKAIFVAEGYDYYTKLFEKDPALVVDMYKEFTNVNKITANDLVAKRGVVWHEGSKTEIIVHPGKFNPRNQFNINPGIVHLSHRANSLGAEVNLAGVSGVARKGIDNNTLQPGNAELLLCCSRGGNPNRNSDPLIGEQAYSQVLQGMHYTLANPVGLYIAGVDNERITLPNGESVPTEWWKVIRGQNLWTSHNSQVLRLELEVPKSENITLSDLFVDGNPVKFGGQLANLLSIHLFILRWKRSNGEIGPVFPCIGTCCRKIGTPVLNGSKGECKSGYELAFPGLVNAHSTKMLEKIQPSNLKSIYLKGRL